MDILSRYIFAGQMFDASKSAGRRSLSCRHKMSNFNGRKVENPISPGRQKALNFRGVAIPNGSANGRESNFVNAAGIRRHSSRITHRRIDNAIICAPPSRVARAAARREFIGLAARCIGGPCRIATRAASTSR